MIIMNALAYIVIGNRWLRDIRFKWTVKTKHSHENVGPVVCIRSAIAITRSNLFPKN